MTLRNASDQFVFRYRSTDSATGVTRATAKRLAEQLGVDETQVIHRALRDLAVKLLPHYEADDGMLEAAQVKPVKALAPPGRTEKSSPN